MTIDNTITDFANIILDESNNITTSSRHHLATKTPTKSHSKSSTANYPITPETEVSSNSSDVSLYSSSSVSSEDEPCTSSFRRETVSISEHKIAELEGRHAEEPLLRENPGRFVLFPIKEPEVSRYFTISTDII